MEGSNVKTILVSVGAALTSMFPIQLDLVYPNNVAPLIQDFFNITMNDDGNSGFEAQLAYTAFMNSVAVGYILSCIAVPFIADKYGRRLAFIALCWTGLNGRIFQGVAVQRGSWLLLLLGRYLSAIGHGSAILLIPILVSEISATSIRGSMGSLSPMAFMTGSVVAPFLGLESIFGTPELWGFPFFLFAGMNSFSLLLGIFMKETPVFLAKKIDKMDNELEVAESLMFYRGTTKDFDSIKRESQIRPEDRETAKWISIFFPATRIQVIVCIAVGVLYLNVSELLVFSTTLFHAGGLSFVDAGYSTLLLFILTALVVYLATAFVDNKGRRPMLLYNGIIIIISLLGLFIFQACRDSRIFDGTLISWIFKWLIATLLLTFSLGISVGPRLLFWILVPELLPFSYRATGKSVTMIAGNLYSMFCLTLIPYLVEWELTSSLYLFNLLASLAALILIYRHLPETLGLNPDQIQNLFTTKKTGENPA